MYARRLRSAESSQHSEHVLGGNAESSQERAAVGGLDPKLFVAEAALNQPLKSQRAAQGDLDNALGKERVEPSLLEREGSTLSLGKRGFDPLSRKERVRPSL